ncbi:MAG: dephospho-CoA kinase [Hyphomicrobiaceae bacterium]|nr:dephospho-CoA kinase [Hyphomicrobiaceae bacterium]
MLIVGLTGSIGMGKSTVARHLRGRGVPVFDADAAVHRLYRGKAAALIEAEFPGTTRDGVVDRSALLAALLHDTEGFARLNAIVHPLVRGAERRFLHRQYRLGKAIAVLEIPLLFETGADRLVDAVMVVTADRKTQRARVLARPGMNEAKLSAILARQWSARKKTARADYSVDSSRPLDRMLSDVDKVLVALRKRSAEAYLRHWRRR